MTPTKKSNQVGVAWGLPSERESELPIGERLNENPSLDMDLMQFLVIAGFTYDWEPLHTTEEGRKLLPGVIEKYENRRTALPHRIKNLETMSAQRLKHYYDHSEEYGYRPLKILRNLRDLVDHDGGRIRTVNLGPATFIYLNSALRHYGVPETNLVLSKQQRIDVQALPSYQRGP